MRLDDFLIAVAKHLDGMAGEPVARPIVSKSDAAQLASILTTSGSVRSVLLHHLTQFVGATRAWNELTHDQGANVLSARDVAHVIMRVAERLHVRLPQDDRCAACGLCSVHCPKIWADGLHIFHSLVVRLLARTSSESRHASVIEVVSSPPPARSGVLN